MTTIREPFGAGAGNSLNVGAIETSYVSAVKEYGDSTYHKTVLTLQGALPAIAGGADLAVGRKLYTFPHKNIRILTAAFNGVAIQQTEGNIDADTPDVGLGTTIASGAVDVLSGTAAFENILTGQTFTDCDGTAEIAVVGSTTTLAKTTAAYAVHFNVADEWAASGDEGATISGDVVITWEVVE
jgi:hypothetical protein